MIIDYLRFNDWSLAWQFGNYLIIRSLPFFWLATLIAAILIIRRYFRRTRHGYRHSIVRITIDGLIISLLIGGLIAFSGLGKKIHQNLSQKPLYYQLTCQDKLWYQPSKGLLAGKIITVNSKSLQLSAPDNSVWLVTTDTAILKQANLIKLGQTIKLNGQITGDKVFQAKEIHSYQNSCGCQKCNCGQANSCQKQKMK
ncbi:MAG TPA: hypothetical protein PKN62_01590 [bacterium]|nr:hypothetical protein [bacterium]